MCITCLLNRYTGLELKTRNSDLNKIKGICTYSGNMAGFTNKMAGNTFVKQLLFWRTDIIVQISNGAFKSRTMKCNEYTKHLSVSNECTNVEKFFINLQINVRIIYFIWNIFV